MDRQDYTRNWHMHHDFQPQRQQRNQYEMRNFPGNNRKLPPLPRDRRYAPSDAGDYRRDYDRMSISNDYRQPGRYMGQNYAASESNMVNNSRPSRPEDRSRGLVNRGFDHHAGNAFANPEYVDPASTEQVRPSWIDSVDAYTSQKKVEIKSREENESISNHKKFKCCTGSVFFRIFTIILIFWDLVMDWTLAGKGPLSFLGVVESTVEPTSCTPNSEIFVSIDVNGSTVDTHICGDTKNVWNVLAVFALIGSLLTILQVINISCEIMKLYKPKMIQIIHGQSEVLLALVVEEIPQVAILVTVFFVCDCSEIDPDINVFALLSTLSSAVSVTMRFISTFDGCVGNGGCCNSWWRCVCCKNSSYCCRLEAKDCFCSCDVPCPLCCCTLHCHSCKWTPKTWFGSCLKAFSCFCECCEEDTELYGVRLVNNLGLLAMWVAVGLQIMIFVVT